MGYEPIKLCGLEVNVEAIRYEDNKNQVDKTLIHVAEKWGDRNILDSYDFSRGINGVNVCTYLEAADKYVEARLAENATSESIKAAKDKFIKTINPLELPDEFKPYYQRVEPMTSQGPFSWRLTLSLGGSYAETTIQETPENVWWRGVAGIGTKALGGSNNHPDFRAGMSLTIHAIGGHVYLDDERVAKSIGFQVPILGLTEYRFSLARSVVLVAGIGLGPGPGFNHAARVGKGKDIYEPFCGEKPGVSDVVDDVEVPSNGDDPQKTAEKAEKEAKETGEAIDETVDDTEDYVACRVKQGLGAYLSVVGSAYALVEIYGYVDIGPQLFVSANVLKTPEVLPYWRYDLLFAISVPIVSLWPVR